MGKNISIICSLLIFIGITGAGCKHDLKLVAGRFAKPGENGLFLFNFNTGNGKLKLISESDVGPNAAYFCFSDRNKIIYVVNEVFEFKGEFGGGLTSLKYDPEKGIVKNLKEILIPYAGPCFISMSADSGYLFIANYPNGSVVVVRLDNNGIPESITDTILYVKEEPDISHAHMILNDPGGKYVYVTDLGMDRIIIYDFDRITGKLNQLDNGLISLPKGSGPRHFVFNVDGSVLYVINELGSTIMVFRVTENEKPVLVQTLPTTRTGFIGNNYCADIHIGKDGKFLYGSNRGENSIAVFKIANDGILNLAGHISCGGEWPRNFVIDPSGKFLVVGNEKSGNIAVFNINRRTGIPVGPVDSATLAGVACLKFRE
jgi:6-phosphogluconolactonase